MSSYNTKKLTPSEKIAEVFMPKDFVDPENDSVDTNSVKIVNFDGEDAIDFDRTSSDIRKQNTRPLSEISDKYKGKVYSRDEFEESTTSESGEGYEEDDLEDEDGESSLQLEQEPKRKKLNEENFIHHSDEADKDEVVNINSKITNQEEIQKGLAVQNQLKLWEKLLEIRIHAQKMVIKANSLPPPELFNKLRDADEKLANSVSELTKNVQTLAESLLEMQHKLSQQYSGTRTLFKSERKRSSQSSSESAINQLSTALSSDFQSFIPYRTLVLQKWDDRTKVLRPGTSMREENKSHSAVSDVINIIETVLLNKVDLIAKSRTVKGNYHLFERKLPDVVPTTTANDTIKSDERVTSCEIYDDTDFYHQQLRELIEFKSNTNSNPVEMMNQFAELQKLRHKMKKKVDMRASKGRKIRYVVHNKLVNFMAPNQHSQWTDDSKSELYRSLFAT